MTPASQRSAQHLTDDQCDDILMDLADPAALAHIADCPACEERVAAFQSSLSLFNQASLAWSAARSNTMAHDLVAQRPHRRFTPAALSACAAGLLLAVLVGLHSTRLQETPIANASRISDAEIYRSSGGPQDRQHEIASDNAMLQAIDLEIGRPESAQFITRDRERLPELQIALERQARN